jgi:hypothetical protein
LAEEWDQLVHPIEALLARFAAWITKPPWISGGSLKVPVLEMNWVGWNQWSERDVTYVAGMHFHPGGPRPDRRGGTWSAPRLDLGGEMKRYVTVSLVWAVSLLAFPMGRFSAALASTPTCFGQPATIVGGPGQDILNGTDGNDVIVGLGDDDIIRGKKGNDLICGGPGNDELYGGSGRDKIDGGAGGDLVAGEDGRDLLTGGLGGDNFLGGPGDDTVRGGSDQSADRLDFHEATGSALIDLFLGTATAPGEGSDTVSQIEEVTGSDFDDEIIGDDEDNFLSGGFGDDFLDGRAGVDILNGDPGFDTCVNGEFLDSCEA